MPYTDALTWLTQRQQIHQDALPDSLLNIDHSTCNPYQADRS